MRKSPVSKGSILVVGDEYFTLGFRIAGVRDFIIASRGREAEAAREALNVLRKGGFGLAVVQYSLRKFFEGEGVEGVRTPIVFVPDAVSAREARVKELYSSLIRKYLGISLELK